MPENLKHLLSIREVPPEVLGILLSMFLSVLRVIYDKEETRPIRIILEALICGGLSMAVSFGVMALEMNINWAIFLGGAIGYFGSATVRQLALRTLNRRFG